MENLKKQAEESKLKFSREKLKIWNGCKKMKELLRAQEDIAEEIS